MFHTYFLTEIKNNIKVDWNAHSSSEHQNKVTTLGAAKRRHVKVSEEIRYCRSSEDTYSALFNFEHVGYSPQVRIFFL